MKGQEHSLKSSLKGKGRAARQGKRKGAWLQSKRKRALQQGSMKGETGAETVL